MQMVILYGHSFGLSSISVYKIYLYLKLGCIVSLKDSSFPTKQNAQALGK